MLTLPPKVFLDTQIVIDVGRGTITQGDWSRAASFLRESTRYCVSPLTIGELLCGLVNSEERHFESHKQQLRILLAPQPAPEVFDFIPYFVADQLGLSIDRPPLLEDDFLGSLRLILDAPSKAALRDGFRLRQNPNQTAKVRVDRLVHEHNETLHKYFKFMERRRVVIKRNWRGPGHFRVEPSLWTSYILNAHGVSGSSLDPSAVAPRLSAAYEFQMSLNVLINSTTFSISRNRGDLVDGQQLFYLLDPNAFFITNDSRIRSRVAASSQSNRVKSFTELTDCAVHGTFLD